MGLDPQHWFFTQESQFQKTHLKCITFLTFCVSSPGVVSTASWSDWSFTSCESGRYRRKPWFGLEWLRLNTCFHEGAQLTIDCMFDWLVHRNTKITINTSTKKNSQQKYVQISNNNTKKNSQHNCRKISKHKTKSVNVKIYTKTSQQKNKHKSNKKPNKQLTKIH